MQEASYPESIERIRRGETLWQPLPETAPSQKSLLMKIGLNTTFEAERTGRRCGSVVGGGKRPDLWVFNSGFSAQ